jgi:hypothetical protein
MVGTVVFPTLSGLRRASSRRQQVAGPGLLLPDGNGLVPWLPARAAWSAGAGVSALVVDPPGGQGPGAAEPGQLQPGRALDSLSIRA